MKGIYAGITFPVKLSILLMISDFLYFRNSADSVLVMLGLDEHRYVRLARELNQRLRYDLNLGSLYSRLTKGLSGYPKMSKSIPESSINVADSPEHIRTKIMDDRSDDSDPLESTVFQMMCQASYYNKEELSDRFQACQGKGENWDRYKRQYVDFVVDIVRKWPK